MSRLARIRIVRDYMGIKRRHIILVVALAILSSFLAVIPAQFVAALADFFESKSISTHQVVPSWVLENFPLFTPSTITQSYLWASFGFLLIAAVADIVRNIFATYVISVSENALHRLRVSTFERALRRPMSDYQAGKPSQAEALDVIRTDVDRVNLVLSQFVLTTASDVLDLAWMMVMLVSMSLYVPALLMLSLPLLYWLSLVGARKQRRIQDETRERESHLVQIANDGIHDIERVKTSGAETVETSRIRRVSEKVLRGRMRATYVTSTFFPLSGLVKNTAVCAVLLGTALLPSYWQTTVTAGSILLLFQYSMRFFAPINNFIRYYEQLQRGIVSLRRVVDVLETPAEAYSTVHSPRVVGASLTIECLGDRIFTVRRGDQAPTQHKSVTIPYGSTVLISGTSGVGKTTLLRSVIGLDNGAYTVFLNDIAVSEDTATSLRQVISYAGQNVFLAHDSLLKNATYPLLDDVVVEEEARNLLSRLGFSTNQIESPEPINALRLSGGEARRVEITRALLKNAPVLLLDEVDANLDAENKRAIFEVLHEHIEDKTTLIVSHTHDQRWRDISTMEVTISIEGAGSQPVR